MDGAAQDPFQVVERVQLRQIDPLDVGGLEAAQAIEGVVGAQDGAVGEVDEEGARLHAVHDLADFVGADPQPPLLDTRDLLAGRARLHRTPSPLAPRARLRPPELPPNM